MASEQQLRDAVLALAEKCDQFAKANERQAQIDMQDGKYGLASICEGRALAQRGHARDLRALAAGLAEREAS